MPGRSELVRAPGLKPDESVDSGWVLEAGTLSSDNPTDGADVPRATVARLPASGPAGGSLGDEDVAEGKLGGSHIPVSMPAGVLLWGTDVVVTAASAAGAEGEEAGRLGQPLLVEPGSGGE